MALLFYSLGLVSIFLGGVVWQGQMVEFYQQSAQISERVHLQVRLLLKNPTPSLRRLVFQRDYEQGGFLVTPVGQSEAEAVRVSSQELLGWAEKVGVEVQTISDRLGHWQLDVGPQRGKKLQFQVPNTNLSYTIAPKGAQVYFLTGSLLSLAALFFALALSALLKKNKIDVSVENQLNLAQTAPQSTEDPAISPSDFWLSAMQSLSVVDLSLDRRQSLVRELLQLTRNESLSGFHLKVREVQNGPEFFFVTHQGNYEVCPICAKSFLLAGQAEVSVSEADEIDLFLERLESELKETSL